MSPAEFQRPSGAPIVPIMRRYLATIVVAAASLILPYALELKLAALAILLAVETWVGARWMATDMFAAGGPRLRRAAMLSSLAALGCGAGAWATRAAGVAGDLPDLAFVAALALAGSYLGATTARRGEEGPQAAVRRATIPIDALMLIDFTGPRLRMLLHAMVRLGLGAVFMAPFGLGLPRLQAGPFLPDLPILIVLAFGFLLGMVLLSQALLIIGWGLRRPPD